MTEEQDEQLSHFTTRSCCPDAFSGLALLYGRLSSSLRLPPAAADPPAVGLLAPNTPSMM